MQEIRRTINQTGKKIMDRWMFEDICTAWPVYAAIIAALISQTEGHAGYSHPLTPFAISLVSRPSEPCEM